MTRGELLWDKLSGSIKGKSDKDSFILGYDLAYGKAYAQGKVDAIEEVKEIITKS